MPATPLGVFVPIGQLDWQAGTTKTLMLNRENEVKRYTLRFEITHTNGATPALTVTDLFRLITEIRIVAGGRNNIKMVNAIKLYLNYLKNYGIVPSYSCTTTASTAGLKSWVIIDLPMNMFDMQRPHDTIFPTYRFQNLDLKVTFGSATSVGTNVTVTAGTITISEDAIENYNRGLEPYGFYKEIFQSKKISSTNPKESIVLPVDMSYKQLSFVSYVDGVLSDAIIQGITVRAGSKILRQYTSAEIKENMMKRFELSSQSQITGFLVVDFGERGHASEFLNTLTSNDGFKQLTIEMDVVNAGTNNLVEQYSDYLEIVEQDPAIAKKA